MVFEVVLGFVLGVISGLVPGVHSNTVASVILQSGFGAMGGAAAIAAMAASHAVFSFIPAIFLFIPDSETVVSVLPGHRMLMAGRGAYALGVCAFSGMWALAFSLPLLPLAYVLMPLLYSALAPNMLPVLVLACAALLASEREGKRIAIALGVFLLSGTLGMFALQAPGLRDPLLCVFCGMFALSGILLSFREGEGIPRQRDEKLIVSMAYLPYVLAGVVLGMLSDLLPGIGTPAQLAVFASVFLLFTPTRFLALVSSIAVSHTLFSIAAVHTIGKARTGAAVAIRELVHTPGLGETLWLLGITVLSASLAVIVLLLIAKRLADVVSGIPVTRVGLLVFAYLVFVVLAFDGARGLLFMGTGAAIGVLPPVLGVRRTHLMGAILVPSLSSLSGFTGVFLSLAME